MNGKKLKMLHFQIKKMKISNDIFHFILFDIIYLKLKIENKSIVIRKRIKMKLINLYAHILSFLDHLFESLKSYIFINCLDRFEVNGLRIRFTDSVFVIVFS